MCRFGINQRIATGFGAGGIACGLGLTLAGKVSGDAFLDFLTPFTLGIVSLALGLSAAIKMKNGNGTAAASEAVADTVSAAVTASAAVPQQVKLAQEEKLPPTYLGAPAPASPSP